jgi:hypothetical protein
MTQARFDKHIGSENICPNIKIALERAEHLQREHLAAA